MKISVVINTYNAEKHLKEVLNSVKEFDEIVICDMHSNDSTLSIANHFGTKVVFHENTGFVEPARNFAIQQAENDWVLLLDADELPTEALKKFLFDFKENKHQYTALSIPRKNYFLGRFMRSAYPDYVYRFFRKENIFWPETIHSKPEIKGSIYHIPKSVHSLAIVHLANDSVSDIMKKNNAYSDAETLRRKGKKVTLSKLLFSPFMWFFKYYLLKKAFLDGKEGFIFSCLKAQYKFATLAKLYESNSAKKIKI